MTNTDKAPERWTVKGWNGDHIEVEDPDGKWVLATDYDALEAEIERMSNEIKLLEGEISILEEETVNFDNDYMQIMKQRDEAEKMGLEKARQFLNNEAAYYSGNEGQLDGIPFEHVAHICRILRDRI